jgi:serine protease AprX
MLRPGKRFYRRPSLPATIVAVTLALIAVPATWALTNRPAAGNQEGDMNAKIAQLQPGVSTRQDAIQLFGKPFLYIWKDQTFQEDNLPPIYVALFPNAPYIVFQDGVIDEIRFETQDCGYVFRDKIRIGSSLDDALAVLAPPRETVVGEGFGWKDRVLYKDGDGKKGHCYYFSAPDHVRMFFEDYRVAALYLTSHEEEQSRPAPTAGSQNGDLNAKIAQLQLGVSTRQDAIRLLGKPTTYLWGDKTFQEDDLPRVYIAAFPNGPSIVFQGDVIEEIRFSGQDVGYVFRDKIRIGSSLDDVLAVLAEPRETVVGEAIGGKDRVLYKDVEGQKGRCYYSSAQDHVRMFFTDYKAVALYLTAEEGGSAMQRRGQVRKTLAAFDDCRWADLSRLDLSDKKDVLITLYLNQEVKWPAKEKMPADFRPDDLFQSAMNPGLGVRRLHARGITGKGVNVGIIDQPLFPDHPEFAGKIAAYHDVGCNSEGSMHGPAVASLLVGTRCGTAPGARLYHVAAPSWTGDTAYQAKALDWLVEQNQSLPAGQKIRVISISAAPSGPGSPFTKNNEMWDEACQRAEAAGILVLDCTTHHGFIGACSLDADDPENVAKCKPGYPGLPVQRGTGRPILAPTGPRTKAEEYVKGQCGYQYGGRGGLSWAIPYTAGVLAMGWQVRPDLSAEQMKNLLLASAHEIEGGYRIIDPENFIRQVQAAK